MSYYFFIGEDILLPIAPEKMELRTKSQNDTVTLINDGEVSLLKAPGLSEISFDATLPNSKYPFALYASGYKAAKWYLEKFEKLKTDKRPFQFIVSRKSARGKVLFNTNMTVSLEDYTIKEDAKNGTDVIVSIELKQYREPLAKTLNVNTSNNTASVKKQRSTSTSKKADTSKTKTYKVQANDTLIGISRKFYGTDSKYMTIAKANNIKNPNAILAGQVLTIPAL